ncbi:MAG: hypothetical protein AAF431_17425 [Pseudomonadota bacterium]
MKNTESDYLEKLFARSSDEADETETDFPLVDVPPGLNEKLRAISDKGVSSAPSSAQRRALSWPAVSGIAASLLAALVIFTVYQQQQTLKQLAQAQADLATALHYLGEAREITRAQMMQSLNQSMKKAAVEPVVEIGRDAVLPSLKSLEEESETKQPTRTL